jgi:hypothetical protein
MANVDRLKQVRMAIVNFEENFNYKYIFSITKRYGDSTIETYPNGAIDVNTVLNHHRDTDMVCGTNACIVGFTLAIQTPEVVQSIYNNSDEFEFATQWLDLTKEESHWLFEPEGDEYTDQTISQGWHNMTYTKYKGHLALYSYDNSFTSYLSCTREQGYNEALRRIDYLIEHYSNANSN